MDKEELKEYLKNNLKIKFIPHYDWIGYDERRILDHCVIKIILENDIIYEISTDELDDESEIS